MERLTEEIETRGIKMAVYRVSPEDARTILGLNTRNRRMNASRIRRYQRNMEDGTWMFTGDPIQVERGRVLANGQHRLTAQVEADVTLDWLLVEGLPPGSQGNIDKNRVRSYVDTLRIIGVPRPTDVGALVNRLYRWQSAGLGVRRAGVDQPPEAVLEEFRASLGADAVADAVASADRVAGTLTPSRGILAGFWIVLGEVDGAEEDRQFFYDRLGDGAELATDSPIYALRKRFGEMNASHANLQVEERTAVALMVKAWNAYRDGQPMTSLRFRQGGHAPEQMPTPH